MNLLYKMSRNQMLNIELGTKVKLNAHAVQSLSWGLSKLENSVHLYRDLLCTSTWALSHLEHFRHLARQAIIFLKQISLNWWDLHQHNASALQESSIWLLLCSPLLRGYQYRCQASFRVKMQFCTGGSAPSLSLACPGAWWGHCLKCSESAAQTDFQPWLPCLHANGCLGQAPCQLKSQGALGMKEGSSSYASYSEVWKRWGFTARVLNVRWLHMGGVICSAVMIWNPHLPISSS